MYTRYTPILSRRTARMLAGFAALSAAVACNDATAPEYAHAAEVEAIRLTIAQGAVTHTVTYRFGETTPALRLPVGTSTITAVFLDIDDEEIFDLDAEEHALAIAQIVPAAAFTFTRTGAFAGTLTAPTAGAARVNVCLTHDGHCDLEFPDVPVVIE